MAEYIEREAALEMTCHNCTEKNICGGDCYDTDNLRSIPSADVQPVRHGRWENINDLECFKCSCCGEYANQPWGKDGEIMFSYCPNCGAKMDGGETSERQAMAVQSQND